MASAPATARSRALLRLRATASARASARPRATGRLRVTGSVRASARPRATGSVQAMLLRAASPAAADSSTPAGSRAEG